MRISILILSLFSILNVLAQKKYSIDDIYTNRILQQDNISGFNSTPDGEFYTEISKEGIVKTDFNTGKNKTLIFDKTLLHESQRIEEYTLCNNQKNILIFTSGQQIYRHSIAYKVWLYSIEKKTIELVEDEQILHATLSPDNSQIAYVKDNNLFVKNILSKAVTQITTDGEKNKIINGSCDWVYEEEFGFTQAFQWSEDGSYIAYYKFDEGCVKKFTMQYFQDLYPENYTFRYPKAGEDNSKISLHLYKLGSKENNQVKIPLTDEYYLPRIFWGKKNQLLVVTLNRLQNQMNLFGINALDNSIKNIYSEKDAAYVSVGNNLKFLSDNSFVISSEKNGYNHLYWYDFDGKLKAQLTNGDFEIRELIGVDEANKLVYFTSTQQSEMENHAYSVSLKSKKISRLTQEEGWHNVSFSSNFNYFLDEYSTTKHPSVYKLKDKKNNTIRTLSDNSKFHEIYKTYANSPVELIKIKVNGEQLNATIMKPLDFDSTKKYPVIIYQYSGPGSQNVKNTFLMPHHYLHQILCQKGYIILNLDTRGTGGRGAKFKKLTYGQLGKFESDDLIETAKWLQTLSFVNPDRLGIWGWSYGGYMSSICILKGAQVFNTAVAVAPVTNWRYYDNIYTERYMGLPKDNSNGYDENSPTSMTSNLKGNYLIMHGLADDNVHFQNAVLLVNQLIEDNKYFDSEFYPNRAHGIGGKNGRRHVYQRIENYFTQNL